MTPEHQRIAIAEACGWKSIKPCDCSEKTPRGWHDKFPNGSRHLPDYLNDLNAMHEAEKVLTDKQFSDYDIQLTDQYALGKANNPIHATASQRAEAFLRTLNLWKE